jgi:hypothetical protein
MKAGKELRWFLITDIAEVAETNTRLCGLRVLCG